MPDEEQKTDDWIDDITLGPKEILYRFRQFPLTEELAEESDSVENDPVTDFPPLDITGDFDIDPWTQQVTTPGQRGTGWCAPSP